MSACLSAWLHVGTFFSIHAQPSTDTSESRVGTHMQREDTLAEEISEKEGEPGQEVTRVSSIATGMERCVPRCEASQDEAKLRAAGPFCAWWLAADVLSWPVNTEDWVCAQEKKRGGEREGWQKKKKSVICLVIQQMLQICSRASRFCLDISEH